MKSPLNLGCDNSCYLTEIYMRLVDVHQLFFLCGCTNILCTYTLINDVILYFKCLTNPIRNSTYISATSYGELNNTIVYIPFII